MSSAVAFLATAVIVTGVQSVRWWITRSHSAPISWLTYMRSASVWIGWPLLLVAGTYMLVLLAGIAATR